MKDNEVFLAKPPNDKEFNELFKFIWLQGIGNKLDNQGQPKPWSYSSLEERFMDFEYDIDQRTIQNWLAGNNKPSPKNLHKLARIVSNDSDGYKKLWRDAFTEALTRKRPPKPYPETKPDSASPVINKNDVSKRPTLQKLIYIPAIFIAPILLLFALIFNNFQKPYSGTIVDVTNLKFCDQKRFDRTTKVCITNVAHFPAETSLIYVSFNLPNAPEGQPFTRKWYREGQLFLDKDGFYDSAWPGYTWLQNENGHDQGKYDLRIILNGRVTTGTFLLGEVNEGHEWP